MSNFISTKDRFVLQEIHRSTDEGRIRDRIKAVLLLDKGWSSSDICEALLIDDSTVRKYRKIYEDVGVDGLLEFKYCGGQCRLTDDQLEVLETQIQESICGNAADAVKFVKKEFNVDYTSEGMVKLLKRLGFVYKKTKHVPGKADAIKQKEFIRQYRRLKTIKSSKDKIYFIDGTHPVHNSQSGYAWIKKGQVKEIQSNTARERLNINGAIDIESLDFRFVESKRINAQSTIKLFRKIERGNPDARRIYLISDNAGYYRSKLVKEYLKTSKIIIKFLPAYSPNLNLIERLWFFLHKKVLVNKYYEKFSEFKHACCNLLKNLKRYKNELHSLLTENFQILNGVKS